MRLRGFAVGLQGVWGRIVALSAVVALAMMISPSATASTRDSAGNDPRIPVVGRTTVRDNQDVNMSQMVAVVHGVRRIPGGTVLYWSGGVALDQGNPSFNVLTFVPGRYLARRGGPASYSPLGAPQLIDARNRQLYTVLIKNPEGENLSSQAQDFGQQVGVMYTYYVVYPELPESTTTVDVALGFDDVVHGVPVEEGALEPSVVQDGPLRTGDGWPAVDLSAVAASYQPEAGVFTWQTEDSTLDSTVVTREGSEVSVDLSADVLFSVDSATLGAGAGERLAVAAEKVNARATGGRLQVVGHTDSSGSDAYNRDLSLRRARAVADALRPLITVSGVELVVVGRGEAEPVASNDSDGGRAENRRVSVVFAPKGR